MINPDGLYFTIPPNIPRTNKAIKKYFRKLNRAFDKEIKKESLAKPML